MATFAVSFDLEDAESQQYETAHAVLAQLGFRRSLPSDNGGTVPLPESTVIGERTESAAQIRDGLWQRLASEGCNPKRLLVGELRDWAGKGRP